VARQARQICRGTWPLNVGDGAVYFHRPGCFGNSILTELTFTRGQRFKYGRPVVSQESGAENGNGVVLLQTPAAAETADKGVKLSADASHVVTSIRLASRPGTVRTQYPWPDGPNDICTASRRDYFRALAVNGSQPAPVTPAGENAPAAVDLARIQAERIASQHGQERITRQDPIKVSAPATHQQKCVALFRGVTPADLPEGI
jgi:hypothetical protein